LSRGGRKLPAFSGQQSAFSYEMKIINNELWFARTSTTPLVTREVGSGFRRRQVFVNNKVKGLY
jgi:hypothetical protein